jgi:hypothetical protein
MCILPSCRPLRYGHRLLSPPSGLELLRLRSLVLGWKSLVFNSRPSRCSEKMVTWLCGAAFLIMTMAMCRSTSTAPGIRISDRRNFLHGNICKGARSPSTVTRVSRGCVSVYICTDVLYVFQPCSFQLNTVHIFYLQ